MAGSQLSFLAFHFVRFPHHFYGRKFAGRCAIAVDSAAHGCGYLRIRYLDNKSVPAAAISNTPSPNARRACLPATPIDTIFLFVFNLYGDGTDRIGGEFGTWPQFGFTSVCIGSGFDHECDFFVGGTFRRAPAWLPANAKRASAFTAYYFDN